MGKGGELGGISHFFNLSILLLRSIGVVGFILSWLHRALI